ncbi:MAG: hypothetical protein HZC28_01685 [Spirochaetes bacterium]|nr:hypothetical protein [Spirochaetota bacterium]
MDHDKQIATIERARQYFLKDVLTDDTDKPGKYNLGDEFKKMKRNRSIGLYVVVFLFLASLASLTVVVAVNWQKKSRSADIAVADFEAFNLTELVNASRRYTDRLGVALSELAELRASRENALKAATALGEEATIAAVKVKYDPLIAEKQGEVNDLRARLDDQQRMLSRQAKKGEAMVDSFEAVMRLELAKQRRDYEEKIAMLRDEVTLLYNPIIASPEMLRIIEGRDRPRDTAARDFTREAVGERIATEDDIRTLRRAQTNTALLLEKLSRIPYTNSVPPALTAVGRNAQHAASGYESIAGRFADLMSRRTAELTAYRAALNDLLRKRRDASGYVIDPRVATNMVVHIDPLYQVTRSATAIVFRDDDSVAATITVFRTPDGMRGSIISSNGPIDPFNRILVKIR